MGIQLNTIEYKWARPCCQGAPLGLGHCPSVGATVSSEPLLTTWSSLKSKDPNPNVAVATD